MGATTTALGALPFWGGSRVVIGDGAGRATRRGIFGVGRVGDVGGGAGLVGRFSGLGFEDAARVFELVVGDDDNDGGGMLCWH